MSSILEEGSSVTSTGGHVRHIAPDASCSHLLVDEHGGLFGSSLLGKQAPFFAPKVYQVPTEAESFGGFLPMLQIHPLPGSSITRTSE
jgi:hypothetical protein